VPRSMGDRNQKDKDRKPSSPLGPRYTIILPNQVSNLQESGPPANESLEINRNGASSLTNFQFKFFQNVVLPGILLGRGQFRVDQMLI